MRLFAMTNKSNPWLTRPHRKEKQKMPTNRRWIVWECIVKGTFSPTVAL
jgi:hypothetical protein